MISILMAAAGGDPRLVPLSDHPPPQELIPHQECTSPDQVSTSQEFQITSAVVRTMVVSTAVGVVSTEPTLEPVAEMTISSTAIAIHFPRASVGSLLLLALSLALLATCHATTTTTSFPSSPLTVSVTTVSYSNHEWYNSGGGSGHMQEYNGSWNRQKFQQSMAASGNVIVIEVMAVIPIIAEEEEET